MGVRGFTTASSVTRDRLALALAPPLTPHGPVAHTSLFQGFATEPQVQARGLLSLADNTPTPYLKYTPPTQRDPVRNAPGDRLRETTSVANPGSARLSAVTPLDGESISSDSARPTTFTWRRASPDAAYRLTVTDEGGSVRWAPETGDTTINLPESVRLERGQTSYWYVDALGGDGRTRASSPRRLRIAP